MGWYGKPDGIIEHIRTKEVLCGTLPKKHKLRDCPKCGSNLVDLWYVGSGNFGGGRGGGFGGNENFGHGGNFSG